MYADVVARVGLKREGVPLAQIDRDVLRLQ